MTRHVRHIALALGLAGCTHTFTGRAVEQAAATDERSGIVTSWFWGQVGGKATADCGTLSIDKVRLNRPLYFIAVSFITLGIINPATYDYTCFQFVARKRNR